MAGFYDETYELISDAIAIIGTMNIVFGEMVHRTCENEIWKSKTNSCDSVLIFRVKCCFCKHLHGRVLVVVSFSSLYSEDTMLSGRCCCTSLYVDCL